MRACLALILLALACSGPAPATREPGSSSVGPASPAAATSAPYPPARRSDTVETHLGVAVPDPYRWLEDLDSAETRAWVADENRLSEAHLAAIADRDVLRRRLAELTEVETDGAPVQRGRRFFWLHIGAQQGQPVLWTASSLEGPARPLFDPATLSSDGSLGFAGWIADASGKRVAYGLSIAGGDWQRWRVRDVDTGRDFPEQLEDLKYDPPAFSPDGNAIYLSRFPAPPPGKELTETDHDQKVYLHRLGTDPAGDVLVYERPDHPTWQFAPEVTWDARYLVLTIGDGQIGDRGMEQVAYLDLTRPGARVVPLISTFEAEYLFAGNDGPIFFFKTNLDAPRKRVIAIDVRHPAHERWRTVVPEGPDAIDQVKMVDRRLLVSRIENAHNTLGVHALTGKKLAEVPLPGLGQVRLVPGPPSAREAFFTFAGFTTLGTVYRYDLRMHRSRPWRMPRLPVDSSLFETRVETRSGHGGGSTRAQKIEQGGDVLAFFARYLGMQPAR